MHHRLPMFKTSTLCVFFATATALAEEQCLKNAWAAYNANNYSQAVQAANECIEQFHVKAEKDQRALTERHEAVPPTGAVSDADKQKIFARGVLNDVAAAYFVKAKSAEALAKKGGSTKGEYPKIAHQAYEAAAKLTYARVWDPQGWFWSPAEAASDRLQDLK